MKDFKLLASHDCINEDLRNISAVDNRTTICEKHGETECYFDKRCMLCVKESREMYQSSQIKSHVTKLINDSDIPTRYVNATIENYTIKTQNQNNFIEEIKTYNFDKDLIMLGTTGIGKTHIAFSLLKKYISEKYNFLESKSNVFYTKFYKLTEHKIKNEKYFDTLVKSDFLIIDEIGVGDSHFRSELLFEIIDQRYDNMLSTMLISNLSLENLKKITSQSLYSRLAETSIVLEADWEDYRLNAK